MLANRSFNLRVGEDLVDVVRKGYRVPPPCRFGRRSRGPVQAVRSRHNGVVGGCQPEPLKKRGMSMLTAIGRIAAACLLALILGASGWAQAPVQELRVATRVLPPLVVDQNGTLT